MFTENQQKIINAVSTTLFQEVVCEKKPLTRSFKRTENTHEEHQKGHYFEFDDRKYCLYVIDIDSNECLGLDRIDYDDYGECEDVCTLGYVKLDKPERDQWEMWRYCTAIERILELGC